MNLTSSKTLLFIIVICCSVLIGCDDANRSNRRSHSQPANNQLSNSQYKELDRYVLNTPAKMGESADRLTAYLIAPAKNDRERARAIYRWVTANIDYDVDGYFSGNYGDLSSAGVLQNRKAVCAGYANLFEQLAKLAGLEVVKINGYAKGYSYAAGEDLSGRSPNHAWNAVKLDGQWHLLDSTWGAGYVNKEKKFVKQFQEHYFLTPPSALIFSHFPQDQNWQLLDQPISIDQFQRLVRLRPAFFEHGLNLISHKENTITVNGPLEVIISAEPETFLLANLQQNGLKLDKSYTFVQREDNNYKILVNFPVTGKYSLNIYATRDLNINSQQAMQYDVNVLQTSAELTQFPEVFRKFNESRACLFNPLKKNIQAGQQYSFKLKVPDAQRVFIYNGGNPIELTHNGDFFEGKIVPQIGELKLTASFPDTEKNVNHYLLKYIVN